MKVTMAQTLGAVHTHTHTHTITLSVEEKNGINRDSRKSMVIGWCFFLLSFQVNINKRKGWIYNEKEYKCENKKNSRKDK